MYDLNAFLPADSGWVLYRANAINGNGWIVGQGYMQVANQWHAYLMKPAPEPVSSVLFLVGSGVLVLVRRKLRRK